MATNQPSDQSSENSDELANVETKDRELAKAPSNLQGHQADKEGTTDSQPAAPHVDGNGSRDKHFGAETGRESFGQDSKYKRRRKTGRCRKGGSIWKATDIESGRGDGDGVETSPQHNERPHNQKSRSPERLDERHRKASKREPNLGSDGAATAALREEQRGPSDVKMLSAPVEWDPDGLEEKQPHRYYSKQRDGGHSRNKSAFEVQGLAGSSRTPPLTHPAGFWKRAGYALDRVFPVIHPLSHIMAIENLLFGLLVIYSLFSATYQIGFNQTPDGPWLYWETSVDGFYYLDCLLQFRVGYFSGTKLPASAQKRMIELGGAIPNTIMDGRKVAWHYLTHWFIVDFVSSYPFDITFAYIQPDRPWSLQLLLLVKLLRLPRFWRARSQLRRFMSQSTDELISLATTVIFIFFYCHVSGCIFWYIVKHEPSPNNFAEQATWDDAGVDKPLSVAPPAVAYLTILYFLIISFASVGYGDLHPASTVPERLWAIFNGACAAVCLGYVVGKITSLVFARSERRTQLRERFDVLHRVIERERLPEMLAVRMTQQLATIWESKIYRYNEEELQNELPTHLRAELLATWWMRHIKPSPLFPHYPPYLRAILAQSNRQLSPPGDYIVHEGQISRSIYVVWKGSVAISSSRAVEFHEPQAKLCNDPEREWRDGQFDAPGSRRGRGSWTRQKADQIKEWFTRTKNRGDDFSDTSGRSDASSQDDWESSETDREGTRGGPKKLHWEAGPGSVIGERALMNQLAQRMRERGADWERIRVTSIVMDVTARSLDETYLIRILVDDLIIDDYPPLLDDLMEALKHFTYTPPGVLNKDT